MNIGLLLVIVFLSILIMAIAMRRAETKQKLILFFSALSFTLYSGIGISYDYVDNKFLFHYFIFLIVLLGTIRYFSGKKTRFGIAKKEEAVFDDVINSDSWFVSLMAYMFLGSLLFNIFAYYGNFSSLFAFSNFSSHTFNTLSDMRSSVLSVVLSEINVLSMPFYFVYLYNLVQKRKYVLGFVLIILWAWFSFGQLAYLGRYQLIIFVLFAVAYILICKHGSIRITKRLFLLAVLMFLIILPLLDWIASARLGNSWGYTSTGEIFNSLVEQEFSYPKYYELCYEKSGNISALSYILWIICLPIPSAIWANKPGVTISTVFTSMALGLTDTSASNYYNVLPSLLGESFLTFGRYFFWILAIILGIIIGAFFKFSVKSRKLSFYNVYLILQVATLGRGGSQGFLGTMINGSIVFIIWYLVMKYIRKNAAKGQVS